MSRAEDASKFRYSSKQLSDAARQNSYSNVSGCYITQANNTVFHIEVDNKSDGQEVLDKVCKMLGIMDEAGYFGVQFVGLKKEMIWLNMRNRLSRQVPGAPPYHLFFKVKYFVPPHTLLLGETRRQFFHNVVQQLKLGMWDSDISMELRAQLVALMTCAQFGPYNPVTTPCKYACFWSDRLEEMPPELIRMAANFHTELASSSIAHVEYELLKLVHLELSLYGVIFFDIKDINEKKKLMGVGPEFICLCSPDGTVIEKFQYCRVHTVTLTARVVVLNLLEDDASIKAKHYLLPSTRLANSLYRYITEVYNFFRCDAVADNVLQQTSRDLKDALTSIFDHGGKDFAFDITSTCREVYDKARRRLHNTSYSTTSYTPPGSPAIRNLLTTASKSAVFLGSIGRDGTITSSGGRGDPVASRANSLTSQEEVQEKIQERLREISSCRICMDQEINRVFFPCGHTICCADCSERVDQCPVCRKNIELRHPCYLPWTRDSDTVDEAKGEFGICRAFVMSARSTEPCRVQRLASDTCSSQILVSGSSPTHVSFIERQNSFELAEGTSTVSEDLGTEPMQIDLKPPILPVASSASGISETDGTSSQTKNLVPQTEDTRISQTIPTTQLTAEQPTQEGQRLTRRRRRGSESHYFSFFHRLRNGRYSPAPVMPLPSNVHVTTATALLVDPTYTISNSTNTLLTITETRVNQLTPISSLPIISSGRDPRRGSLPS